MSRLCFRLHANPNVRGPVYETLDGVDGIAPVAPQHYLPFAALTMRAHLIVIDSGCVQEEAPALSMPVLVMRDTTENPGGVEARTARLIGAHGGRIVAEAVAQLDDPVAYQIGAGA